MKWTPNNGEFIVIEFEKALDDIRISEGVRKAKAKSKSRQRKSKWSDLFNLKNAQVEQYIHWLPLNFHSLSKLLKFILRTLREFANHSFEHLQTQIPSFYKYIETLHAEVIPN